MLDERAEEIFERLAHLEIELDPDPIRRGPKYLNGLVASCRNYTNEVQVFMREVSQEIRALSRDLHQKRGDFSMVFSELMANDEDIKKLLSHSKSDREALANTKLQAENLEIQDLTGELLNLRHIETVLKAKLGELKDINRDIRLQKQIIRDEIETGAMWGVDHGDYNAPEIPLNDVDLDSPEIEDLLVEVHDTPEPAPVEPDYEDLFSDLIETPPEPVSSTKTEFGDLELDLSDVDVKVLSTEKEREPVGQLTGVLQPQEYDDLDFDAALKSLG